MAMQGSPSGITLNIDTIILVILSVLWLLFLAAQWLYGQALDQLKTNSMKAARSTTNVDTQTVEYSKFVHAGSALMLLEFLGTVLKFSLVFLLTHSGIPVGLRPHILLIFPEKTFAVVIFICYCGLWRVVEWAEPDAKEAVKKIFSK